MSDNMENNIISFDKNSRSFKILLSSFGGIVYAIVGFFISRRFGMPDDYQYIVTMTLPIILMCGTICYMHLPNTHRIVWFFDNIQKDYNYLIKKYGFRKKEKIVSPKQMSIAQAPVFDIPVIIQDVPKDLKPVESVTIDVPKLVIETGGILVQDAIPKFINVKRIGSMKTWARYESTLLKKLPDAYLMRSVREITRADMQELAMEIGEFNGPAASNAFVGIVKSFFSWMHSMEMIESNTLKSLKKLYPSIPRDRVLNDNELVMVWEQIVKEGYPFGIFMQLLLLTGQRRNEVAHIKWSELDLENGIWIISSTKVKNKNTHIVNLSDLTVALIRLCPKNGEFVFTTTGRTPISGFAKPLDRVRDRVDIPHWTFHDLRRTLATNLAKNQQVPDIVIATVLNHDRKSLQGVTSIYNKHTYLPEQKQVLQDYTTRVISLISETTTAQDKEQ